jgi:hypothetical protein
VGVIDKNHIRNGFSYEEYRQLSKDLSAQGKTSGPVQSEELVYYSKLNSQRMDRLDKQVRISGELSKAVKAIRKKQYWVVLTETWCGDAAQNLPVIAKMAGLNSKIDLRILLRDENPEVMDAYLTRGGRSIPKLISLDEQLLEIFSWGPRPEAAEEKIAALKKNGVTDKLALVTEIQKWYHTDAQNSIQQEFFALLTS